MKNLLTFEEFVNEMKAPGDEGTKGSINSTPDDPNREWYKFLFKNLNFVYTIPKKHTETFAKFNNESYTYFRDYHSDEDNYDEDEIEDQGSTLKKVIKEQLADFKIERLRYKNELEKWILEEFNLTNLKKVYIDNSNNAYNILNSTNMKNFNDRAHSIIHTLSGYQEMSKLLKINDRVFYYSVETESQPVICYITDK